MTSSDTKLAGAVNKRPVDDVRKKEFPNRVFASIDALAGGGSL
jgi:hypothetical protein